MSLNILRSSSGQYFVRVVASNGLTLAHSETYTTKTNAMNCAELIKTGAGVASIRDLT